MAHSFTFTMMVGNGDFETNKERANAEIQQVLGTLNLGEFSVDIVPMHSTNRRLKVFIHYSTTTPAGAHLQAELAEKEVQQKELEEGEVFVPKIIYLDKYRNETEQFWKIYKSKTPAERAAEQAAAKAAKAAAFRPRIV